MGNWIEVETELGPMFAADFLGGVLVAPHKPNFNLLHQCLFIEGYRVKMKTGDGDHNKLVRR